MQAAGNARWSYNWGLARKKEAWDTRKAALEAGTSPKEAPKVPTAFDLSKELNVLKKTSEDEGGCPWMYKASKAVPQVAFKNLDLSFSGFFRRLKSGQKAGYPRYKSRSKGIGGFGLTGVIRVATKTIQLPRIGRVRIKPGNKGYIPWGKYSSATVTERAGRWFVSVLLPDDIPEADPNGKSEVGLDMGVVRLATLSDGTIIENPRTLNKYQRRLAKKQKNLSKKKKGSRRRAKAKASLARLWLRITNIRNNHLHQSTTSLTKSHGKIVVEDLKLKNMTKKVSGKGRAAKAGLNRSMLDAALGEFIRQLDYKVSYMGVRSSRSTRLILLRNALLVDTPNGLTDPRKASFGAANAD